MEWTVANTKKGKTKNAPRNVNFQNVKTFVFTICLSYQKNSSTKILGSYAKNYDQQAADRYKKCPNIYNGRVQMQKPLYAIDIKCVNERCYATFPNYISGFHINFPWIYRFLHMSPSQFLQTHLEMYTRSQRYTQKKNVV